MMQKKNNMHFGQVKIIFRYQINCDARSILVKDILSVVREIF